MSLTSASLLFAGCALVILLLGPRLTQVADQVADRTGWGEALTGAVLLGATTSLPGSVLSVTAATRGHADLAVGNALGGIAVQTFFLAVADLNYRRANLEHAAASLPNMMQNALLLVLLSLIALGPALPDFTVWGIHPLTVVMFATYAYGLRLVDRSHDSPMWRPAWTHETRPDEPEKASALPSTRTLTLRFGALMAGLGLAGWLLEAAASSIVELTFLEQSTVGLVLTSVCTSLPELVTSIAAVRQGALTLAVGGIIGGNAFDTLFTAASDLAYREGSIYHAMDPALLSWVVLTLLMNGVLMMGLLGRQERGPARIGSESLVIICLYVAGLALLVG